MQAPSIVALLIASIPVLLIALASQNSYPAEVTNLYNIASKDLSCINNTPNLQTVMQRYFYQLYVRCYRSNKYNEVCDIIDSWLDEIDSIDIRTILRVSNAEAKSLFWSVIDDADAKNLKVVSFKIDETHDYHVLPKSLQYNDSFCLDDLLSKIDNLLEVI